MDKFLTNEDNEIIKINNLIKVSQEQTGVDFTKEEIDALNELPNNEAKEYYINERTIAFEADNIRSKAEKKKNPERWKTLMNRVKKEIKENSNKRSKSPPTKKVVPPVELPQPPAPVAPVELPQPPAPVAQVELPQPPAPVAPVELSQPPAPVAPYGLNTVPEGNNENRGNNQAHLREEEAAANKKAFSKPEPPVQSLKYSPILNVVPEGNNTSEQRNRSNSVESVSEAERMAANAEADAEGPSEENIRKYENAQIEKLVKNSEKFLGRKFTDEEFDNFNKLPIDKKISYLTKRNKEVGVDELKDYMTELLGFAKLNNARKARSTSPPPQIPFLSTAKGGSRKVSPVGPGINMRVKRAPKKKTRKAKKARGTRKL